MINKIIEIEKKYPNKKIAVVLRHGDRDLIPPGEIGNEIPINEIGKNNAIEFGKKIKHLQINKIYTSPILRCIQTAEYIASSFERETNIHQTKCLGDPGLHIDDEIVAGKFYLDFGFDEMYRRFCNNTKIPGVPNAFDFRQRMDNFIKEHCSKNGITIFITHDSLIAFYKYSLTGIKYTKENWVNYLNGIIRILE